MRNFWHGSSAKLGSTSCCDARRIGDAYSPNTKIASPLRERVRYPRRARSQRRSKTDLELKGSRPYARVTAGIATAARSEGLIFAHSRRLATSRIDVKGTLWIPTVDVAVGRIAAYWGYPGKDGSRAP
jgi:hypothetical protein